MTKKEQEQFFDDFTAKMKSIMVGKGDDYATDDRLSNFKFSGSIVGTGKDGRLACLQLIAVKVARLGTLLNSKNDAKNESIDDSMLDLANYSVLLAMLQGEQSEIIVAPKEPLYSPIYDWQEGDVLRCIKPNTHLEINEGYNYLVIQVLPSADDPKIMIREKKTGKCIMINPHHVPIHFAIPEK